MGNAMCGCDTGDGGLPAPYKEAVEDTLLIAHLDRVTKTPRQRAAEADAEKLAAARGPRLFTLVVMPNELLQKRVVLDISASTFDQLIVAIATKLELDPGRITPVRALRGV